MSIIGRLVNQFNGYFLDPPTLTRGEFQGSLNRNAYVLTSVVIISSINYNSRLYLFLLFLGRFTLAYVNKVYDFPRSFRCQFTYAVSSHTA